MRRAERLFALVQLLRAKRVSTAQTLAQKLQISERTVYRDVQDLQRSGVPILG
jgi:predicted DNA-binding transcriptional regulator YafY